VVTSVDVAALDLSDTDLIDSIDAVHVFKQQVAALEADLIRSCDQRDIARRDGSSSLPSWLSDRSRISPAAAHRLVELTDSSRSSLRSAPACGMARSTPSRRPPSPQPSERSPPQR
jgi:Domain of unknown function (DUF222)